MNMLDSTENYDELTWDAKTFAEDFAFQVGCLNKNFYIETDFFVTKENPLAGAVNEILTHSCRQQILHLLELTSKQTQSIIENIFFQSILLVCATKQLPMIINLATGEKVYFTPHIISFSAPVSPIEIFIQFPFKKYKLDFLLSYANIKLAVECDGQTYHTLRKVSQRDKIKDRKLQESSINIFRFTGKELLHNPVESASQAVRFMTQNGFSWH